MKEYEIDDPAWKDPAGGKTYTFGDGAKTMIPHPTYAGRQVAFLWAIETTTCTRCCSKPSPMLRFGKILCSWNTTRDRVDLSKFSSSAVESLKGNHLKRNNAPFKHHSSPILHSTGTVEYSGLPCIRHCWISRTALYPIPAAPEPCPSLSPAHHASGCGGFGIRRSHTFRVKTAEPGDAHAGNRARHFATSGHRRDSVLVDPVIPHQSGHSSGHSRIRSFNIHESGHSTSIRSFIRIRSFHINRNKVCWPRLFPSPDFRPAGEQRNETRIPAAGVRLERSKPGACKHHPRSWRGSAPLRRPGPTASALAARSCRELPVRVRSPKRADRANGATLAFHAAGRGGPRRGSNLSRICRVSCADCRLCRFWLRIQNFWAEPDKSWWSLGASKGSNGSQLQLRLCRLSWIMLAVSQDPGPRPLSWQVLNRPRALDRLWAAGASDSCAFYKVLNCSNLVLDKCITCQLGTWYNFHTNSLLDSPTVACMLLAKHPKLALEAVYGRVCSQYQKDPK